MKNLVVAGKFTLVRTEEGTLVWRGAGEGDQEEYDLEELSLRPGQWPVGTVVVAYEPQIDSLSSDEQKRVFGVGMEITKGD